MKVRSMELLMSSTFLADCLTRQRLYFLSTWGSIQAEPHNLVQENRDYSIKGENTT